jgi:hypothetical protein
VPGLASPNDLRWPGGGGSGLIPGGAGSSASGSGASGAAAGLTPETAGDTAALYSTFHVHTDDALPGAPVFDTDVAPD